MPQTTLSGGCLCGCVRYTLKGDPVLTAVCHCSMCRKASAAPAVAWAMYRQDQVTLSQAGLREYHSSPEATRSFCQECGTQIAFRADYVPGMIDITLGSLDDPNALEPTLHYWYSKHLSWVHFGDSLPKYPEFPLQEVGEIEA
jgi:hypothetical protein